MIKNVIKNINKEIKYKDVYSISEAEKKIIKIIGENDSKVDLEYYYRQKYERSKLSNPVFETTISVMIAIIGMFISSIISIKSINDQMKFDVSYVFCLFFLIALLVDLIIQIINKMSRIKTELIYQVIKKL